MSMIMTSVSILMTSVNEGGLICSSLRFTTFASFSCFIEVARTSSAVLNGSGIHVHLCSLQVLRNLPPSGLPWEAESAPNLEAVMPDTYFPSFLCSWVLTYSESLWKTEGKPRWDSEES